MTDPIADLLTQIRNGYKAGKAQITLPHSSSKLALAKILNEQGYIGSVSTTGQSPHQALQVNLLYSDKLPSITGIKRLSTPGRRLYSRANKLVTLGEGTTIVSTSQGLMTQFQARKQSLGGELICKVW